MNAKYKFLFIIVTGGCTLIEDNYFTHAFNNMMLYQLMNMTTHKYTN